MVLYALSYSLKAIYTVQLTYKVIMYKVCFCKIISNYWWVYLFIAGLLLVDQVMTHQMFASASDEEQQACLLLLQHQSAWDANVVEVIAVLLPLSQPFILSNCSASKTYSASEVLRNISIPLGEPHVMAALSGCQSIVFLSGVFLLVGHKFNIIFLGFLRCSFGSRF